MDSLLKAKTAEELKIGLLQHEQATLVSTYNYEGDLAAIEECLNDYIEKYPRTRDTLHLMVPAIHYQRVCARAWSYTPRMQDLDGAITLTANGADISLEAIALYKVNEKAVKQYAKELDEWLVKHSVVTKKVPSQKRAHVSGKKQPGQPSVRTKERFAVFQKLRERHPTASMAKIAILATDELGIEVTEVTISNTYRSMKVKWERGDRIR